MEHNDLEVDISCLEINDRKRRSSGGHFQDNSRRTSSYIDPDLDENSKYPRRSNRKRIRPLEEKEKRRVISKPKKFLDGMDSKQTINYYLDKRVKRLPPSLETIFEEPNRDCFMSSRKFRRFIQFPSNIDLVKDKTKVKKRTMKAKKNCNIKTVKKKLTMELLMQKLSSIDSIESTVSNIEKPVI